jgi:7-cyano-7-deazaguanine synthase
MANQERKRSDFVVISGGPDSATLLEEVRRENVPRGIPTEAIFINFGQPYLLQELTSARSVAAKAEVPLHEVQVPGLTHALAGKGEFGYIIFRNVIEASYGIAASFARYNQGRKLYHANLKEDVDDLPWMPAFFQQFAILISSIESDSQLQVASPYIAIPKQEVFERAAEMGLSLGETWSCLQPGKTHCGECRSCIRRKKAFKEAGLDDETTYLK